MMASIIYRGTAARCSMNDMLKWSGKNYRELKVLVQEQERWKRNSYHQLLNFCSEDGTWKKN